ncbi:hypothetical protein CSUI_005061 [Cystoisospora suis]|uniref:Uncharacterized protein n=1 Tax=Cystoisospora suis TaxID=483139 RepID=A0A2C6KYT5_9APIC|nr:hypothetical protein CSUI_005061 [Cystoisospora suis]
MSFRFFIRNVHSVRGGKCSRFPSTSNSVAENSSFAATG